MTLIKFKYLMIATSIFRRTIPYCSYNLSKNYLFTSIKEEAPNNSTNITEQLKSQSNSPILSQQVLNLCSPLMKSILSKTLSKQVKGQQAKSKTKKELVQQQIIQNLSMNKHDLSNFRHMLAGPLLSQANLDKFCLKKTCPLVVDIKYDGERTMISYKKGEGVEMISRNGKTQDQFYSKLNQTIKEQLQGTDIQSIKLDGQIVAINNDTLTPLPFGQLLKQKKYKNPQSNFSNAQNTNIVLLVYIFDVLQKDGKELLQSELIQRRKLIPTINIFKPVQHKIIHFPEERAKIFQFFREALQRKYQGLIIKGSKDFYYTNDSRTYWKKLKRGFANNRDTKISKIELDLIVMGANRGQGNKNSKSFTSYLLGTKYQGKIIPISNVGSGLTQEMIQIINKHITETNLKVDKIPQEYELGGAKADIYFKPSLVFEVHAQELSLSPLYKLGGGEYGGLSLRFPIFKGIRSDKGVEQATKGEQILQLSKSCNFNLPS